MDFAKILSDLNIDPKLILINIIGFGVLFRSLSIFAKSMGLRL